MTADGPHRGFTPSPVFSCACGHGRTDVSISAARTKGERNRMAHGVRMISLGNSERNENARGCERQVDAGLWKASKGEEERKRGGGKHTRKKKWEGHNSLKSRTGVKPREKEKEKGMEKAVGARRHQ